MTPLEDKLLADALALPRAERRNLVRALVLSLDEDEQGEAQIAEENRARAWNQVIARRTDDVLTGQVERVDGQQVHDELRAHLADIAAERR